MLKKALIGAIFLPLMAAPGLAQSQSGDHHYQGGPKTEVPHHVGPKAGSTSKNQGKANQAGQHHYQGGPKEIHHIGDMPKTTGEAPKQRGKAKKKKKRSEG